MPKSRRPSTATPAAAATARAAAAAAAATNGNENLALDMSDDGDEARDARHGHGLRRVLDATAAQLGGCLAATGARAGEHRIIIDGPSGRVNFVKVNGQASGSLCNCISRVMRAMQFPTINGPRTRAEFDINL